jgi:hypothetical protein
MLYDDQAKLDGVFHFLRTLNVTRSPQICSNGGFSKS